MLKSFLISMIVLVTLLFKFNVFFTGLINSNQWMILYVYIIIALVLVLYGFAYEIFSGTGPLGKFVFYFLTTLAVVSFVLIPFNNLKEFVINFSIASCIMLTPVYFVIKKVQQFNTENYSIVKILNEKLLLTLRSNFLISLLSVSFITLKPI